MPAVRVVVLTGGSATPTCLDFNRQESLPWVSSCGVFA
jgi:hypothetical protein